MLTTFLPGMFLALAELPHQLHAGRNFEMEFDSGEGKINSEYFGPTSNTWVVQQTKTAQSSIFSIMDIIKPLPNDTLIEATLFEKYEKRFIQSFVKYRNNFCDYLRLEKRPFISSFKEFYKFPPTCPVQGVFKLENFRPDEILPPVWPGPDLWKVTFNLTSRGSTLYLETIKFHIDRKGNRGRG